MVLLGCNTNACLYYLLKNMTKTEVSQSLSFSLRTLAFQWSANHHKPMTLLRTSDIVFLTRVAKKMNGCIEISAMMSSLTLLGAPADFSSCQFFYVSTSAAIHFVVSHPSHE